MRLARVPLPMTSGLIPSGKTIVQWVSPEGVVTPLHGPGSKHVWLGEGPEGLGSVDVESILEAAARQHGETFVGTRMDAAELDLPIHIKAGDPEELRRRIDVVTARFERFRPGWLCTYSVTRGWRWVQARMSAMRPELTIDPQRHVRYDVTLLVESPLSRSADSTGMWVNTNQSGRGQIALFAGRGEWPSWAQFMLRGPGTFRLRWAGNDITFPWIAATEWCLVNTDESRQTIRVRNEAGQERNAWPEMPAGTRVEHPVRGGHVTRVDVQVSGGSPQSSAWGSCPVQHEGLV